MPSEVLLALLGGAVVLATRALRTFLDQALLALADFSASPDTSAWATKQKQFAFYGITPLIVGAAVAVAAVITTRPDWLPWHGVALLSFYVAEAITFGAVGQLAWSFGALLVILYRASHLDMAVEVFAWPRAALRSLTRCYLSTCTVGIFLYLLAIAAIWVTPRGYWHLTADSAPVRQLWVLPLAATLVAYLLGCQGLLYRIYHRVHEKRLTDLSVLAQKQLNVFLETGDTGASSAVSDFLKWRESVEREMAQKLSMRAFGTMIVTVMLPAAKTVKELLGW